MSEPDVRVMPNRGMKRIDLRSSFPDRMGRPMPGLFEVLLDEDRLAQIAEQAYGNTTRRSTWGFVYPDGYEFSAYLEGVIGGELKRLNIERTWEED